MSDPIVSDTPNIFRSSSRTNRSPQLNCSTAAININTLLFSPTSCSPCPAIQVLPPRDSKSNCPQCSKFVADGFCCDSCQYWFHPDCIGIPKTLIKRIANVASIKIECQTCRNSEQAVNSSTQTPTPASITDAANQTESVVMLHQFCQYDSPIAAPPATPSAGVSIVNITCSTQTSPPLKSTSPIVPLLDLTDDDNNRLASPSTWSPKPSNYVIVQGENDPLSNFYNFSLEYEAVNYSSLEQCYQHLRAIRAKKSALAASILKAKFPQEAKSLSKQIPRLDNRDADVSLMENLLHMKAGCCASFRSALSSSGSAILIHSTHPSDRFWGSGLFPHQIPDLSKKLPGLNTFGHLLTKLRPIIDSIPYAPTQPLNFAEHGAVVVLLNDGEKMGKHVQPTGRFQSSGIAQFGRNSTAVPQSNSFCFHCGIRGHVARVCRLKHREVKCYSCSMVGHKKRYCPFINYNYNNCSNNMIRSVVPVAVPPTSRPPLLPTPPSFSPGGPNYRHNFPPLAPASNSQSNFH